MATKFSEERVDLVERSPDGKHQQKISLCGCVIGCAFVVEAATPKNAKADTAMTTAARTPSRSDRVCMNFN